MIQSNSQRKAAGSPYYRRKTARNSTGTPGINKTKELPLKNRGFLKKILFVLAIVSMAFILLIWLQIQIDAVSVNIQDLNRKINDLQSNNNFKKSELEKETTYDIVYPIVKSKFNMDFPDSLKIILPVPDEVLSRNK